MVSLGALVLVACGPNLKKLELRQANDAIERKDYRVAAEHFKRACELDPQDTEVCARAASVAHHAVDEAITAAQTDIGAHRYAEAINRLNEVRKLDKKDKVGPLIDRAADAIAGQCEALPFESVADSVRMVRCLEANRVAIDRAAYSARVGKGRARAGELSATVAQSNTDKRLYGTGFVQFGVARCLSGDMSYDSGKERAFGGFYQTYRIPTTMRTHLPWSTPQVDGNRQCAAIAARHPLLECGGAQAANALSTEVIVTASAVTHTVSGAPRQIEYVDHIETYPNPEWAPLRREHERERRAMMAEASQYDRAKARCDSATSAWHRARSCMNCYENSRREAACNDAEAARDTHNRRVDEVNRLQSQLQSTPRELQREVLDVFHYVEREHRYSMPYRLRGAAISSGTTTPWNDEGSVDFQAIEHVGFAKANLRARPLVVPRAEQYQREITERAAAYGTKMVERDLQGRAESKLSSCGSLADPNGLECWLAGQALKVTDPTVPYTAYLSEQVGNAYPPAGCR